MDQSMVLAGGGVVVLVAVGLFLRALLKGGKMIEGLMDRRDAEAAAADAGAGSQAPKP